MHIMNGELPLLKPEKIWRAIHKIKNYYTYHSKSDNIYLKLSRNISVLLLFSALRPHRTMPSMLMCWFYLRVRKCFV